MPTATSSTPTTASSTLIVQTTRTFTTGRLADHAEILGTTQKPTNVAEKPTNVDTRIVNKTTTKFTSTKDPQLTDEFQTSTESKGFSTFSLTQSNFITLPDKTGLAITTEFADESTDVYDAGSSHVPTMIGTSTEKQNSNKTAHKTYKSSTSDTDIDHLNIPANTPPESKLTYAETKLLDTTSIMPFSTTLFQSTPTPDDTTYATSNIVSKEQETTNEVDAVTEVGTEVAESLTNAPEYISLNANGTELNSNTVGPIDFLPIKSINVDTKSFTIPSTGVNRKIQSLLTDKSQVTDIDSKKVTSTEYQPIEGGRFFTNTFPTPADLKNSIKIFGLSGNNKVSITNPNISGNENLTPKTSDQYLGAKFLNVPMAMFNSHRFRKFPW